MCIGGKKKSSSGPAATPPKERVNPRDPEYGPNAMRDPDAAMSMIAGVFTNARGVLDPANRGRIRLGGGSLLPAVAPGTGGGADAPITQQPTPTPTIQRPRRRPVGGGGGSEAGGRIIAPVGGGGLLPWAYSVMQQKK